MEVLLVDTALALVAVGVLSVVRPLRFLRIRSRRIGALVAVAGLALLAIGLTLPVRRLELPPVAPALDGIMSNYEFGEHHELQISAPPERVYAAVRAVTAEEIRLFRLLTWLRSPRWPGTGRENILNPAADRPILDVALGTGFVLLHDAPGHAVVVGAIVCCGPRRPPRTAEDFQKAQGSLARAVMSFELEPRDGGTRLVTQTRIQATDAAAERSFAAYWRVIYPGSAVIRWMWLRAIRDRAEAGPR